MSAFPYQDKIDEYYEAKKKEVGEWLIEFANAQKRLTEEQYKQLLLYAEQISFSTTEEVNDYVQSLKTVGKQNKRKIFDYFLQIEWFPEGINHGILDGRIVNRIEPNELDLLYAQLEREGRL